MIRRSRCSDTTSTNWVHLFRARVAAEPIRRTIRLRREAPDCRSSDRRPRLSHGGQCGDGDAGQHQWHRQTPTQPDGPIALRHKARGAAFRRGRGVLPPARRTFAAQQGGGGRVRAPLYPAAHPKRGSAHPSAAVTAVTWRSRRHLSPSRFAPARRHLSPSRFAPARRHLSPSRFAPARRHRARWAFPSARARTG
jgi:hypothetical protein